LVFTGASTVLARIFKMLQNAMVLKIGPGTKPFLPLVLGLTRFLSSFDRFWGVFWIGLVLGSWLNQSD